MPGMNFSPLTKVELDNAIDVILILYEWDIEVKKKEYHIGPLSAEDFGPAL